MKRVIICIDETREVYRVAGTGNALRQEVWVDGHLIAHGTVSMRSLRARIEALLTRPRDAIVTVAAGAMRTTAGPVGHLARPSAEAIAQAALAFLHS